MEKICKFCGGKNDNIKSEFCSFNCYMKWRYHNTEAGDKIRERSRKRMRKVRKDPKRYEAEKLKKQEYWNRWVKKNRDKYNRAMREVMRKRNKTKPENYRGENKNA